LADSGAILERDKIKVIADCNFLYKRLAGYHKPARETAKREIRRLIVEENKTNQEISSQLKIPLRSVQRYVAAIYKDDNNLLIDPSNTQALTQLNIAIERLSLLVQTILEEVTNAPSDTPLKDKVDAWHLAGEIIATLFKFTTEAPAMMARRHMFPAALIDKTQSSGLTLVLKKNKQQEDKEKKKDVVVYDELDLTRPLTKEEIEEDEQDQPIEEPSKNVWKMEDERHGV
jgi:light-regulated signal transduction histidine kinase (bacteriophytochrome)